MRRPRLRLHILHPMSEEPLCARAQVAQAVDYEHATAYDRSLGCDPEGWCQPCVRAMRKRIAQAKGKNDE